MNFQVLQGSAILPYVAQVAELRIEIFREFPYLYKGDMETERGYFKSYSQCLNSLFVIARENGKVVGALTGIPLADALDECWTSHSDMAIDRVYYWGDIVVQKQHRGKGLGKKLCELFEKAIKEMKSFEMIAFKEIIRAGNHPKRPKDYHSLDAFWQKRGYKKHPELTSSVSWKEIGSVEKVDHEMVFWLKTL